MEAFYILFKVTNAFRLNTMEAFYILFKVANAFRLNTMEAFYILFKVTNAFRLSTIFVSSQKASPFVSIDKLLSLQVLSSTTPQHFSAM